MLSLNERSAGFREVNDLPFGDLTREGHAFTDGQDRGPKPPLGPEPPACTLQDPKEREHERQLKKKEKNRASAQRSRQRHTDKADALHQVGVPPFCLRPRLLAQWPLFHPPMSNSPHTATCSLVAEFGS